MDIYLLNFFTNKTDKIMYKVVSYGSTKQGADSFHVSIPASN